MRAYVLPSLTLSQLIALQSLMHCHLIKSVVSLQLVKAGLALGLFGGTHKFLDDKVVLMQSCGTLSVL